MSSLNLKPTHKVVKAYYEELAKLEKHGASAEGAVAPLFAAILRYCAHQFRWIFQEKYAIQLGDKTIYPDGALRDDYFLYGIWEAKSSKVDLDKEIKSKFDTGYPQENILFQTPYRAVLWQNGERVTDCNISEPETLVDVLKRFFEFRRPEYDKWKVAVSQFGDNVKTIGRELLDLITPEYHKNKEFARAFDEFFTLCKQSINPNLSKQAVEKMLVQHLMTERIFNRVFYDNTFVDRNVIASEIKKVILVLTSRYLNLHEFLRRLDPFYQALESTAASIHDFSQKQTFLNTVYEKFFQEFSEKEADTHGIVYTPQPIVHFIVNSVEEILQKEFGRSLSDEGVHILDPFVGTGNFIIHVMQKIKRTALSDKYEKELHCNEVMLLPYYIASMNIEHEYYTVTGEYKSFEGICFVDTFELAEKQQAEFGFMTEKNTERVNRQKAAPIFVILGNPPYNAGQVNENDNNKNRKYEEMDRRIRETYAQDSQATNKNALSDVYVKAIKWASDRIKENGEGIVAFVTNNGFIDGVAFDGMRKHLAQDFSKIYHIDLKGNARTAGERRRREGGNIFDDAIRVGVGITFFVRTKDTNAQSEIYLYSVDDYWKARDKKGFLEDAKSFTNVQMKRIIPDDKHSWLTEGIGTEFEAFIPIGTKEAKTSNQQTNEQYLRAGLNKSINKGHKKKILAFSLF
jgi:predicted helicase